MESKKGEKREAGRKEEERDGREGKGGRKGRHLAEESKFTKRKLTKVHCKPMAPYPARLGTDHQLSQSSGAGAGRTLQKAEQRQRMAAGGRMQKGTGSLTGGWVCLGGLRRGSPRGDSQARHRDKYGQEHAWGSPAGEGQGHRGCGPEVWMLLRRPKQERLAQADKPRPDSESSGNKWDPGQDGTGSRGRGSASEGVGWGQEPDQEMKDRKVT